MKVPQFPVRMGVHVSEETLGQKSLRKIRNVT